jgi:hypothetical protein
VGERRLGHDCGAGKQFGAEGKLGVTGKASPRWCMWAEEGTGSEVGEHRGVGVGLVESGTSSEVGEHRGGRRWPTVGEAPVEVDSINML